LNEINEGIIMYDEMIDDIFEQKEKKNRKSLQDIPKYNLTDEQEDDFDIAYRTPKDINEGDLLPTEWEEHKIGETSPQGKKYGVDLRGVYHRPTGTIHVVEDDFFLKNIEYPKNEVLLHENTHKMFNRKRDKYIMNTETFNTPIIESEIRAGVSNISPGLFENNELEEYFTETEKRSGKPFSAEKSTKFRNEFRKKPEELFAVYAAKWPEDILNPRNKISKKLNRMWFD